MCPGPDPRPGDEIFPGLTARDNLRMATAGAGLDDGIIDDVLEDFPRLRPRLDRPGGVLSGGEQQILALARCLCARPKLVLLDEPSEGIQPSTIEEIAELLSALCHKRGLAWSSSSRTSSSFTGSRTAS